MEKAFVLRYQEAFMSDVTEQVTAGTQTMTEVHSEQADSDREDRHHRAIPTESRPVMGTKTKTAVKAEADDDDPRRNELTAIARMDRPRS